MQHLTLTDAADVMQAGVVVHAVAAIALHAATRLMLPLQNTHVHPPP